MTKESVEQSQNATSVDLSSIDLQSTTFLKMFQELVRNANTNKQYDTQIFLAKSKLQHIEKDLSILDATLQFIKKDLLGPTSTLHLIISKSKLRLVEKELLEQKTLLQNLKETLETQSKKNPINFKINFNLKKSQSLLILKDPFLAYLFKKLQKKEVYKFFVAGKEIIFSPKRKDIIQTRTLQKNLGIKATQKQINNLLRKKKLPHIVNLSNLALSDMQFSTYAPLFEIIAQQKILALDLSNTPLLSRIWDLIFTIFNEKKYCPTHLRVTATDIQMNAGLYKHLLQYDSTTLWIEDPDRKCTIKLSADELKAILLSLGIHDVKKLNKNWQSILPFSRALLAEYEQLPSCKAILYKNPTLTFFKSPKEPRKNRELVKHCQI